MTRAFLLLLALFALLAAPAAAAERSVPFGWLGVTVDGPVRADDAGEWNKMSRAGVESVRVALRWLELQPYAEQPLVPAEDQARFRDVRGVPTDFSSFDGFVAAAAARRMEVLPVVQLPPFWASIRPGDLAAPPRDPAAFARFMTALVERYGPDGAFWRERPDLPRVPIGAWQIWNEPNISLYWSEQPFAPTFVPLLRAAAQAVRQADPGATVVLAGLTNTSWEDLPRLYDAGARGAFDAVAVHPYTRRPRDVVRIVGLIREEMRARGDGALPIWVTELSWPSARGHLSSPIPIVVGEAAQALRLRAALRQLARARKSLGIARVFWYTWLSQEGGQSIFDWSGLRRVRAGRNVPTPALFLFRRVARRLEGCAKRPSDARACA